MCDVSRSRSGRGRRQVAFRKGLVKLGRICGYEIIDGAMETEYVTIQTPLAETTGERVKGLDNVVIINDILSKQSEMAK